MQSIAVDLDAGQPRPVGHPLPQHLPRRGGHDDDPVLPCLTASAAASPPSATRSAWWSVRSSAWRARAAPRRPDRRNRVRRWSRGNAALCRRPPTLGAHAPAHPPQVRHWLAPVIATVAFTGMFLFSALVVGPAITSDDGLRDGPARTPTPTQQHSNTTRDTFRNLHHSPAATFTGAAG